MYQNQFDSVLEEAKKKYEDKKVEYGESWKQMTPFELATRLFKEMEEFGNVENNDEAYQEVLDVVNVALMLGVRLKEEK